MLKMIPVTLSVLGALISSVLSMNVSPGRFLVQNRLEKCKQIRRCLRCEEREVNRTYVLRSFEPETSMWPSGCHVRSQIKLSWASSMLATSLSALKICRNLFEERKQKSNLFSMHLPNEPKEYRSVCAAGCEQFLVDRMPGHRLNQIQYLWIRLSFENNKDKFFTASVFFVSAERLSFFLKIPNVEQFAHVVLGGTYEPVTVKLVPLQVSARVLMGVSLI